VVWRGARRADYELKALLGVGGSVRCGGEEPKFDGMPPVA